MKDTKKQQYKIPFRTLCEGEHHFGFQLDASFFEEEDVLVEYVGKLDAGVVFFKQDSKNQLDVALKGMLETTCDRCLGTMEIPFESSGRFYLREAEEGEEEKEDVVFVAAEDNDVELSQLFYEMLVLGLPQKKMHDIADCDEDMLRKMEALKANKDSDKDPRWAELEKLIQK